MEPPEVGDPLDDTDNGDDDNILQKSLGPLSPRYKTRNFSGSHNINLRENRQKHGFYIKKDDKPTPFDAPVFAVPELPIRVKNQIAREQASQGVLVTDCSMDVKQEVEDDYLYRDFATGEANDRGCTKLSTERQLKHEIEHEPMDTSESCTADTSQTTSKGEEFDLDDDTALEFYLPISLRKSKREVKKKDGASKDYELLANRQVKIEVKDEEYMEVIDTPTLHQIDVIGTGKKVSNSGKKKKTNDKQKVEVNTVPTVAIVKKEEPTILVPDAESSTHTVIRKSKREIRKPIHKLDDTFPATATRLVKKEEPEDEIASSKVLPKVQETVSKDNASISRFKQKRSSSKDKLASKKRPSPSVISSKAAPKLAQSRSNGTASTVVSSSRTSSSSSRKSRREVKKKDVDAAIPTTVVKTEIIEEDVELKFNEELTPNNSVNVKNTNVDKAPVRENLYARSFTSRARSRGNARTASMPIEETRPETPPRSKRHSEKPSENSGPNAKKSRGVSGHSEVVKGERPCVIANVDSGLHTEATDDATRLPSVDDLAVHLRHLMRNVHTRDLDGFGDMILNIARNEFIAITGRDVPGTSGTRAAANNEDGKDEAME